MSNSLNPGNWQQLQQNGTPLPGVTTSWTPQMILPNGGMEVQVTGQDGGTSSATYIGFDMGRIPDVSGEFDRVDFEALDAFLRGDSEATAMERLQETLLDLRARLDEPDG